MAVRLEEREGEAEGVPVGLRLGVGAAELLEEGVEPKEVLEEGVAALLPVLLPDPLPVLVALRVADAVREAEGVEAALPVPEGVKPRDML